MQDIKQAFIEYHEFCKQKDIEKEEKREELIEKIDKIKEYFHYPFNESELSNIKLKGISVASVFGNRVLNLYVRFHDGKEFEIYKCASELDSFNVYKPEIEKIILWISKHIFTIDRFYYKVGFKECEDSFGQVCSKPVVFREFRYSFKELYEDPTNIDKFKNSLNIFINEKKMYGSILLYPI